MTIIKTVTALLALNSHLGESIPQETDPRSRMQLCRQTIGLGRAAVKLAEELNLDQISEVQDTLRLGHRESKGTYNPNASITKLAKWRMKMMGITELPIISATRPRVVATDTACIAIADAKLTDDWMDTPRALKAINSGKYFFAGVGFDGGHSVTLRLIDADEPLLDPSEYKRVVEALPPFQITVSTGRIYFGAAENIEQGAGFLIENGTYLCAIVSLRSGRNLRYIATLVRSENKVGEFYQTPEFREL